MAIGALASVFVNVVPNVRNFGNSLTRGLAGPLRDAGQSVSGLSGAVENLPGQFGLAGTALDKFTDGALQNISRLGHNMATAAALAAETAFAGAGVRAYAGVEAGFREVTSLFGEVGETAERSVGQVSDQVRGLSNELGIAQDTLTKGLYEALSAGVPRENAVDFLRVATKAGIAGVTDTQTAVVALAGTLNAFQIPMSDVEKVADSFFATVAGGQTTFPELAMNMADVSPVAAATGVSLQEVGAAIATLTAAGTRTPEATTQIRAAIQSLARPTKEMTAIWKANGYESGEAALRQIGFAKSAEIVQKAAGGSVGKMVELLGSIEAVNAVQTIGGTQAGRMSDELRRQEDATGATIKAYDVMERGAGRAWERMSTSVQNFNIVVGEALIPTLKVLTSGLQTITDFFTDLPKPIQQSAAGLVLLGTALGPPVFMIWRLSAAWRTLAPAVGAMKTANAVGGIKAMGDVLQHTAKNTLTFRMAWVGLRGMDIARTGADALKVGGAFRFMGTAMAGLAGPAGIIAGIALAFGILDSAMKDVEGSIKRLNTATDARLLGEFAEAADQDAADFGSTAKNFLLTAANLGEGGILSRLFLGGKEVSWMDTEFEAQLGVYNKIIEQGNFALAKRILIQSKGTDAEGALQKAYDKGLKSATAGNAANEESAKILEEYSGKAVTAADATDKLTDAQKEFQKILAGAMGFTAVYGEALTKVNEAVVKSAEDRRDKIKDALEAERDALDDREKAELALIHGDEATQIVKDRYDREREALEKRTEAETKAADAHVESERKRAEKLSLSAAQTKAAVQKRIGEVKKWYGNLAVISARGGTAIIDELMGLGPDAADLVAELATMSQPELNDFIKVVESGSAEAVEKMRTEFETLPGILEVIGNTAGTKFRDGLVAQLQAGTLDVGSIIQLGNTPLKLEVLGSQQRGYPLPGQSAIPGFQHGGRFRGLAVVGERGPELIYSGADSTVVPNHALRSSVVVENVNVTTRVDASADEVASAVGNKLAWRLGTKGGR